MHYRKYTIYRINIQASIRGCTNENIQYTEPIYRRVYWGTVNIQVIILGYGYSQTKMTLLFFMQFCHNFMKVFILQEITHHSMLLFFPYFFHLEIKHTNMAQMFYSNSIKKTSRWVLHTKKSFLNHFNPN